MLPKQLFNDLLASMESTFDEQGIVQFTAIHEDKFGEEYPNVVAQGTSLPKGLRMYLEFLEKNNHTFKFIREYCEDATYKDINSVSTFYADFQKVYEFKGQVPSLRSEFLDYIFVDNDSQPFIGRQNVKTAVETLLNNKRPRITVLKGESRMGLSYIRRYLNEVAARTGQFELVNVDLREIKNEYAPDAPVPQLLYASHVAAYISGILAIGFDVKPDEKTSFKHSPFIGALKKHIQATNKTYLFFIDQFEVPPANDVRNIILGIVNLSLDGALKCYTFLSGVREEGILDGPIDTTMLRHIKSKLNTVPMDWFDEQQIETYFKQLYKHLTDTYEWNETEGDFLQKMYSLVVTPDDLAPPNVETIGENVANWYEDFRAQNSL